ncbi:hypothetical protein RhiirA4_478758 [Rhizophagus irregularis]|uniref:Uncharacterized protein n=1 Tax=Rhizophagus irregularis TaxID=588596 RepID=A0A2I1HFE4_9GLOM|nr:hypothetical protein RhiirA4_478758 [Rhizophagus irregularis]
MTDIIKHNTPNTETLTPTQAILRLYKPCKIFPFRLGIKTLNPYTSCDTRGSGTLYNTKKGRYFLLSLNYHADKPLSIYDRLTIYTNDTDLSPDISHTYRSTSDKPNFNFLLEEYANYYRKNTWPYATGLHLQKLATDVRKHISGSAQVRKRFNVSSIPQYNYGYTQARARHLNFTKRLPSMIIDTIPENPDNLITYVISDKDRSIINDPSVFLRRTPPPDDTSITTISDNSYASAAESVATVIYPPTPAGDSEDKTEQ